MNFTDILFYIGAISIVVVIIVYGDLVRSWYSADDHKSEYHMIKTYLLNESPLYGKNKPKLWIHSRYELNARVWKSFQSRTSTDLNQPYLHLTIQSLVAHNGEDFHICLIDDDSFAKLLPTWKDDLKALPEPIRSAKRQLALMQLLYYYGGIVVPDSFVCSRPLLPLYQRAVMKGVPFMTERLNRHSIEATFVPDVFFAGCKKNDEHMIEFIEFLKTENIGFHIHSENIFTGRVSQWLQQSHWTLINGSSIGIKNVEHKPILLENLLAEEPLGLAPNYFGVYIPEDEVLKRTAYQWFAVMSKEEILKSRMAIGKELAFTLKESSKQVKSMESMVETF